METVVLKANDFKTVHNTLCELRSLANRMTHSMIKIDDVQRIIDGFEQGLADAYAQDDQAFSQKMDYYGEFKSENGLRSVWSIYDTEPYSGFLANHPYPSDSFVVYKDHWGDKTVHCAVNGPTWGDIYRAADRCIQNSGDDHHMFIEGFILTNGNELVLQTGS